MVLDFLFSTCFKLELCLFDELAVYVFWWLTGFLIIIQFIGYSSLCFADGGAHTIVTCESDVQAAEEAKRNIVQAGAADRVSNYYYYTRSIVVPHFPALTWFSGGSSHWTCT